MTTRIKRTRQQSVEEEVVEAPEAEESFDDNAEAATMADQDRIEDKYRARATSPLRAIRAFCVLCMGCQPRMVADCTAHNCVLYPFRMGKNPYQKRGTKE